jgi:signal transduction histidine kinase
VQERTAELASTVSELTETQVQLVQAERLAAVGELAAGVAHEVNNPLNFAQNSLRTLGVLVDDLVLCVKRSDSNKTDQDEGATSTVPQELDRHESADASELASDVKELVGILGSGLDRTARLVSDLRDFAKPNPDHAEPFALAEAVQNAIQLTRSSLKDAGVEIEMAEVNDDLPLASADQSSIGQVILNLIKNAMDASRGRSGGLITIAVEAVKEGQMLQLSVIDNGHGIDEEISGRIFDPFFTTKDAGKGAGLGLPMCQRILHEIGGEISIESDPKVGTHVDVTIPAATAGGE